jgi:conjugal transfer mating pair stabilization protein TraG
MVISIPIIATAIIKGGEVAFQAITGVGPIQSAVSGESSATSKGNVSQDMVSFDQQQLAPTRTSAFMSTTSNAHGTTIQGAGPDAGVFRYQATLSRLATTFTFTDRQATALTETAREAETLARSERESMQRSQASALTRALGIQESFERSQQRSGATNISEGGSTSTQLQTLSSVAREVNRRLGLGEDSTVGKSVAAAATVGLMVPFTKIGAQARAEGQSVDQQRLQSAYDYARKATETSQLTDAAALVKEFRSSDAFQWARGSRNASTSGFESSYRDAVDHQSSSESAYSRAKELARTAQFMREWSSGAQTDFTNYAARRLAERGLLREDDPIKLQRAVTEIAYSYARGGNVASEFVPAENPLLPSRPLPEALGWPSQTLRSAYEENDERRGSSMVQGQAAENDGAVVTRQTRQGVAPGQRVGNDLSPHIASNERQITMSLDSRRREVSQTAGTISEDYNATVKAGKIRPHHGGNRAVWDTVGAQTDNRANLGTPLERSTIGEWHFDKDGVPVADPKTEVPLPDGTASPSSTNQRAGRSTDGKSTAGNR